VNLQLWAVVTGTNNPGTQDGFQEVIGSIISTHTATGSVHGNLSATLMSPFDDTASQDGEIQDLNGDGDLDVGSDDTSTSDNYFFARSGGMDFNGTVSNNTNSFEIATLTYTVTSLTFGQATDINFVIPPFSLDAIWREDNLPFNNQNGSLSAGTPVVITSNAAPPLPTGTITGNVFNDANGNGTQDSGEAGISGVSVYIDATDAGVFQAGDFENVTNSSGVYSFSGLSSGTYIVRQIVPTGDEQTAPANSAANTVVLATNSSTVLANFGDKSTTVVTPSTGSITGTVFNDANDNGVQDSGELGISGVSVYIDATNAGVFKSGDVETTTNTSGVYSFTGLSAGTYVVRQIIPTGDTQTLPTGGLANHVTLATNSSAATSINFGDEAPVVVAPTGSITGTVFDDANDNGKFDSGELGISGVSVYIDATNAGVYEIGDVETTTNAIGVYGFSGLTAGAYIVRQLLPTGDTQTLPSGGLGNHVSLATNSSAVTGANFGDKTPTIVTPPTGVISGTVFNDANGNGVQDSGELGIAGVTVYLDTNNDGTHESTEPSTTTNASGAYSFIGLSAGTYVVRQIVPTGDQQTLPAGTAANTVVLATNSSTSTGDNFGDETKTVVTPTGSITGTVFNDANGNGVLDSGELGISGVSVYIDATNAGVFKTGDLETTTNASGVYSFSGLPAGTYIVRQIIPTGDKQTLPTLGYGNHVTLAAGQAATGANFGDESTTVVPPPTGGSITGTVFNDANGNGKLDSGELGIAGVTVYIDPSNSGVFKTGDLETTTNASGVYSFTVLAAGTYIVRQILPTGDKQTAPASGFGNHVTLAANQAATGENFGDENTIIVVAPGGSITGTVFNDANGNGVQDSGELGIAGVTVFIDPYNTGVLTSGDLETTTNASGVYSFTGLAAGTYVVRQILPSGDKQTLPTLGYGNHVTLAANQAATGENFGDEATTVVTSPFLGTISGTVFDDANGNGKLDSGEVGIAGVTVYIDLTNAGSFKVGDIETTTDSSGDYSFSGLPAGTYVIRQILPSGDKQTAPSGANSIALTAGQIVTTANFGDESTVNPVVVAAPASIIDGNLGSDLNMPAI